MASVSLILDSVIAELVANPARKFIYCEQAFFQRWWAEQGEAVRDTTRRLVANHQLEFVNGGWTQHDEANPYYVDMIDQTTLGHRFLLEQFNYVPRIGWQIDPFGHSATQPTLTTQAFRNNTAPFMTLFWHSDRRQESLQMCTRPPPHLKIPRIAQ